MGIHELLFGIIIVSAIIQPITGECDARTGPSGIVDCFSSIHYGGKYQWGTCLTKAYAEQRSKGKYTCRDPSATFCYYQCMVEQHDLDEGPVYDDCLCRPDDTPQSTEAPLPAWCHSPDGTECSWYRTCLEKRFPCTRSGTSYALDYGEKFCNLYTENYNGFDEIGQRWIDAVRKCLQVALVILLRPYNHPSCDEIKEAAFRSHSGCYVSPYPGAPSFCDIGWSNYWKIIWTIKSAFASNFWDTVGQGLKTGFDCISNNITEKIHMFKISVERKAVNTVENLERSLMEYIPDDVSMYIFDDSTRRKRSTDTSNSTIISVLLFDRKKYDLNYKSVSNTSIDGVITKVMDNIETGKYQLNIGVPIEEISFCPDIECQNPTRAVVPGQEKESTGMAIGATIGITVGVIVGVIVGVALLGAFGFFFIRKK
ncbi:uncharacterized protein LOC128222857 [Mya arenaria]|uniref:uncharacterized protein LOC128222857 n=1 Tax=Mya arenaria TaxID=6604 RepID=UPI0022E0281E|nr:uncharacterized protein LOC128222857 [Mya arenaria]